MKYMSNKKEFSDNKVKNPSKAVKHENFRRLAEARVKNILKYFRLIGNLSNKRNYFYTHEEVKKIIDTLENEMNKLKIKFEPKIIEFKL